MESLKIYTFNPLLPQGKSSQLPHQLQFYMLKIMRNHFWLALACLATHAGRVFDSMSSKNRLTDGIPLRCGFFGQEFENIKSMTTLITVALPALQILLFFIKCAILYIHFGLVNRLFVITYLAGISGQGFFL